ncbi:MAG: hypothetical protein ACYCOR_15515 [Acidobacteriaceae bacterium]
MKGGNGAAGGLLIAGTLLVLVVTFGEDFGRFLTDAERERRHPSAANFGRAVWALARTVKDAIGISEV